MEQERTVCRDCGHVHRWLSYKWLGGEDGEQRAKWNRENADKCPACNSANVRDGFWDGAPMPGRR
jgi:RNA polymerase subunit RPABC4/transcription elongation factor Spt4